MKRFIIERDIPAIGAAEPEEMRAIARRSIALMERFRPDIEWVESYVADDKMFCVYLAKDAILESEDFAAMYPHLDQFKAVKRKYDPQHRFRSRLSDRLGIT